MPYDPVTPIEYARHLKRIMTIKGYTVEQMVVLLDKSPDWIREQLSLLEDSCSTTETV